ncbi:MAG: ATP-binding cassette domain-containing protein, partial [Candidatus Rokuibacteriota bacterium]
MSTLQGQGLTKIYREGAIEVPAVVDVSVEADAGETIGIVGPSGSGKTTLLSMLGAILRPTAGTVSIGGQAVWDLDERQLPFVRRRYV